MKKNNKIVPIKILSFVASIPIRNEIFADYGIECFISSIRIFKKFAIKNHQCTTIDVTWERGQLATMHVETGVIDRVFLDNNFKVP